MFVMMNAARIGVGMQSRGLTEVAYQNALAYAKDRIQMRSLAGPKNPDKPADSILVHPDPQDAADRQGLCRWRDAVVVLRPADRQGTQSPRRSGAQGMRGDGGAAHPHRQSLHHRQRLDRHPHCMQVFGGHGYIAEWGMEMIQSLRARCPHQHDLRLVPTRSSRSRAMKTRICCGRKVRWAIRARSVLAETGRDYEELSPCGKLRRRRGDTGVHRPDADKAAELWSTLTFEIRQSGDENPMKHPVSARPAAAADYMRVAGHTVFAFWFAKMAKIAHGFCEEGFGRSVLRRHAGCRRRVYFAKLLPEIESCAINDHGRRAGPHEPLMEHGAGAGLSGHLQPPLTTARWFPNKRPFSLFLLTGSIWVACIFR